MLIVHEMDISVVVNNTENTYKNEKKASQRFQYEKKIRKTTNSISFNLRVSLKFQISENGISLP